jgi:hypothetical protein
MDAKMDAMASVCEDIEAQKPIKSFSDDKIRSRDWKWILFFVADETVWTIAAFEP